MSLLIEKRNQYEYAFKLLVADYMRVCEFIEPIDQNLKVNSHRLYELLLRSCTEFESICREILANENSQKNDSLNITDYAQVENRLLLSQQVVMVNNWRPESLALMPFKTWSIKTPSLDWYKDYNAVKHNRNTEFTLANLKNVRDSLAGLFAILARINIIENDGSHEEQPGSSWYGTYQFDGIPFSLKYTTEHTST